MAKKLISIDDVTGALPDLVNTSVDARVKAVGDSTYAPLPSASALTMTALPSTLFSSVEANAVAFGRSNVRTVGQWQYAVWWDSKQRPIVGQRRVGDTAWSTYDLTKVAGNPLASPLVIDGHNNITIAVDQDGFLHVSGNMHNMPLRYVRSTQAHNITAWTAPGMVGTNEDSITYPQFVDTGATLLFLYRNGGSGDGDTFLNRYNRTTKTWTRVSTLFVGTGYDPAESAYHCTPAVDPTTGDIHLFVVWRQGLDFRGTHDICHIKSTDGGTTWKSITGTALTMPLRPPGTTTGSGSITPVVVPMAPWALRGLINQTGASVDAQGRPHAAWWLYNANDASVYELHHIWHDGTEWHDNIVHSISGMPVSNVGTIGMSRPAVVCPPDGRTLILWRNTWLEPQTLYCQDVSAGARLPRFALANLDLQGWEPNYDYEAVQERGELHMMLTPVFRDPNQVTADENWQSQWGAILSVDLSQLHFIAAGLVPVPGVEVVRNASGTLSNSATTRAYGPSLNVPESTRDLMLVRLTSNARAQTAAATLSVNQRASSDFAGVDIATLTVPGNSTRANRSTPWVPIRPDIEDIKAGAVFAATSKAGASGSVDAPAYGIDLARITVGSRPVAYTAPVGGTFDKLGNVAAYWRFNGLGLALDAPITNVPDLSGNNRHLTPHATGTEPLFKPSQLNGFAGARFGGNKCLKAPAFTLGNTFTIITVALSDGTVADEQQILCAWDSANATPIQFQLRYDNPNTTIGALSRTKLSGVNEVHSPTIAPATAHVIAVRRTWSTYRFEYELWIDGVLVASHAPQPSGGNPGMDQASPWYMGARFSGGVLNEYLNGYVGDTVLFDSWLNAAEFRAAQKLMASRYGISLP